MDTTIYDLLKRSAAIPSMPQVAARFLEIVQDPEFDYNEVVEVLSTDAGTVSELLRLANSPLFGVTRQITSLSQALTLLGLKRVRSLVLGRYIVESIDQSKPPAVDTSYYWRRSLATAVLAARLADTLEPRLREEAFICGLLADIGVVILDEALGEQYRPLAEQYRPHGRADLAAMERAALGVSHANVSAMVLEHWRLPDVVCEGVRGHEAAAAGALVQDLPLARFIGAADHVAKYLCESPGDMEQVAEACRQTMTIVDLDPAMLVRLLTEIEPQVTELASLLRIDVISSQVYGMIAAKLQEQLAQPVAAS
ncbi:MAG: HDOD domain-containing protein [Phycisphaerae bacterium]|nr:HDOD domain-containing protein [Phycisphaerae bacterium]